MNPTISIIMATYNRAHFIKETLISIQNQTDGNWECLIVDDGGTDNTFEVINDLLKNDQRFQYLKRKEKYKKGLPGCRNYGLDLAKGDFIIFFDDDDIIHPDNLKICLEAIKKNKIDFCHYQKSAFEEIKPVFKNANVVKQQSLSIADIEKVITQEIGLASCTVMWNKDCFKIHQFNEQLMYAEEWECYSRILSEGYKGIIIDSVLYFNRKHPNSNTGEFFTHNPIRRASKKDAILLVIQNLKQKKLLTSRLLRYFIQMALQFKEYSLFNSIISSVELSFAQQIKWKIFYSLLPLRLSLYRLKKQLVKK